MASIVFLYRIQSRTTSILFNVFAIAVRQCDSGLEGTCLQQTRAAWRYTARRNTRAFDCLSPTCQWCVKNHNNILEFGKQVSKQKVRLVAIVLWPDPENPPPRSAIISDLEPTFEVFYSDTRTLATDDDLIATPQLAFLSSSGAITHSWMGAWNSTHIESIETLFRIGGLPGVLY